MLEIFVNKALIEHLEVNNILFTSQHGFRSGRSVDTNLIQTYELVTTLLDEGFPVEMILLDLSKAFDKVCHEFLIIKLRAAGVNEGVVQWIMGFLSVRSQSVRVFDLQGTPHFSSPTTVLSGVPQGTILGPTLFNFYVNKLPTLLSNLITLYADDSKLVGKAATPSDQQSIQTDLDSLERWANMWLLTFNVDKCHVIHLGKNNKHHKYFLQDNFLSAVSDERDLGVIVDHQLKFSSHAKSVSSSPNKTLGIIKRTISSQHPRVLMKLYKVLVRPRLEVGMSLAAPFFKKDRKLLEDVQRRATKMVTNMNKFPYKERLHHLKLPMLTYQRKRGDIILTKKILSKNTLPGLFAQPLHSGTRGHSLKLSMQHSTSRHRSHFFSQRIINMWNQLSEETVSATSIDMFKSHLDKEWLCQEFLHNWEAAESSTRV